MSARIPLPDDEDGSLNFSFSYDQVVGEPILKIMDVVSFLTAVEGADHIWWREAYGGRSLASFRAAPEQQILQLSRNLLKVLAQLATCQHHYVRAASCADRH